MGIFQTTRYFIVAAARNFSSTSLGVRTNAVYGIDFGISNSRIAVMEEGVPKVFSCEYRHNSLPYVPSMVRFSPSNEVLTGIKAYSESTIDSLNTIFRFKPLLGMTFGNEHVKKERRLLPFKIVKADNGEDALIEVNNKRYTPSEIASYVLQELKVSARPDLFHPRSKKIVHPDSSVMKAVIAVPACFNDVQRRATGKAGRLAGFDVEGIIDEPIAAAYSYDLINTDGLHIILSFGGTLELSLLEISNGQPKVKAKMNDLFLGGREFDICLVKWMLENIYQGHNLTVNSTLERLLRAAEMAKIKLSSEMKYKIDLKNLDIKEGVKRDFMFNLTRGQFGFMVRDVIDKIRKCCGVFLDNLNSAGIPKKQIHSVVLVGGLCCIPKVQSVVVDVFDGIEKRCENPTEAVVRGTAIAGSLGHFACCNNSGDK